MGYFKVIAIMVGALLLGFLVASIALFGEHAFLLWVAAILLVIWAISSVVVWLRSR
jgi:hypothetical protein